MSEQRSVWLLGGADAGKSNYLTRTWLAIRDKKGLIELAALPEEFQYLNTASTELVGGRFVSHTSRGVHVQNVIPIRSLLSGQPLTGELVIPDYSGEDWLAIQSTRRWSAEWEVRLPSLAGCLLFLRAGSSHIVAPLDWMACFEQFGAPVNLSGDGEFSIPTQVVVIDWLQFLRDALRDRHSKIQRLRVGIVISAWDLVPADQQHLAPGHYIAQNFPLLSQFMLSNDRDYEFASFGSSIVGEDFNQVPGFRDTFLQGKVTEFGYVVHELGGVLTRSADHTLPIAWAFGVNLPCIGTPGSGSVA